MLFDRILEKQLILKGIITPEDWSSIQSNLRYDFMEDNHFEEMKNTEILQNRVTVLRDIDEYVGKYYSQEWIRKNILHQTEDEIEEIDDQIKQEEEGEDEVNPSDGNDQESDETPPEANTEPEQQ